MQSEMHHDVIFIESLLYDELTGAVIHGVQISFGTQDMHALLQTIWICGCGGHGTARRTSKGFGAFASRASVSVLIRVSFHLWIFPHRDVHCTCASCWLSSLNWCYANLSQLHICCMQ